MSYLKNNSFEEPQTIFDLEPDELEFLFKFRELSLKNKKELFRYLEIDIEIE